MIHFERMHEHFIQVNGRRMRYAVTGKGPAVLLVHGFTESLEIWEDFAGELSPHYTVICPDLPGHGESECAGEVHTMEMMAGVVRQMADDAGVGECAVVGHSMGGYVSLAFAEANPERVRGLCLFHSTAGADSEEARANRDRAIEAIRSSHSGFLMNFIPDLFAPEARIIHQEKIAVLVQRAQRMTAASVIAAQAGMRDRPDRTHVLASANWPVLFMLGKLDARIPFERVLPQVALPDDAVLLSMGGVAHMGYIEARNRTLYALRTFLEGIYG